MSRLIFHIDVNSTIRDLAHTPLERVQKIVGMKLGKQLHDYANGAASYHFSGLCPPCTVLFSIT